ncbi:MAG: TRAP transporter fused permease subunit [Ectothiorhodospiraceae bacterium]|nr:TRAP transporter fused permease subunit [Ectothiorhodospiraceae bacterium]
MIESEPGPAGEGLPTRGLHGRSAGLVAVLAVGLALFHLWSGYFGAFPNILQRAPHVGIALALAFALYGGTPRGRRRSTIPAFDLALLAAALAATAYTVLSYDRIMSLDFELTVGDQVAGAVLVVLTLEAGRRVIGWFFPALAVLALAYAFLGPWFPGVWVHRGLPLDLLLEVLFATTRGLWGLVTGISATVIAMFVIFGAVLVKTGGGQAFIDLSIWLSGRQTGGAAKVATIASSLFGAVSGSAAANVATTGTFTIPLMKRLGYRADFAAGVECVASTGGQLMPPIMGAGAFIMAELLGVSYLSVAAAGLMPALLYYGGAFAAIHFESHRVGYHPVPPDQIPPRSAFLSIAKGAPVFVPLGVLVALLVQGYTPVTCAFWAIVAAAGLFLATDLSRAGLLARSRALADALRLAGQAMVVIAVMIACAQIVLAVIATTGVGVKFSSLIIGIGQDNLLLSLVLAMVIAMVLGMGLPTAAAYILAAAVVAPALVGLGVEPLVAHMFVFYFAIMAGITPPICGTVFIAAAMAQTDWLRTAGVALRLALAAFIVPFMFVYNPALIGHGEPWRIALAMLSAGVGVTALAAGAMGFLLGRLDVVSRGLLIATSLLLIFPGWRTDLPGAAVLGIFLVWHRRAVGRAVNA